MSNPLFSTTGILRGALQSAAAVILALAITTQGFGESQPVATNDTEEGRAQNRRVVSVIEAVLTRYETRQGSLTSSSP